MTHTASRTSTGMSRPTTSTMRGVRALVVLAVAGMGITGCASSDPQPAATVTVTAPQTTPGTNSSAAPVIPTATIPAGRTGTPRGGPPALGSLTATDATAVASAVIRVFHTWDAGLDTTPQDAKRRALPLLGEPLASAVRAPMGGNGGGGAAWTQLYAHQGWTTAVTTAVPVDPEGGEPDTPTTATRVVDVTTTWRGAKGWHPVDTRQTWSVTVTRASSSAGWAVTQATQYVS